MESQRDLTSPTHAELMELYQRVQRNLDEVSERISTDRSDSSAITYNYLRNIQNEIIKLMILRMQISPNPGCKETVDTYMKPDQYDTSAPADRKKIEKFETEIAGLRDPEQIKKKISADFLVLVSEMRSTAAQNHNISYSKKLCDLLNKFNPEKIDLIGQIKLALKNTQQRHGKLYTDADVRAMDQQMHDNPYLREASALIEYISKINTMEIPIDEKLKNIHMALYETLFKMRASTFEGFYDQRLRTTIAAQIAKLEIAHPDLRKSIDPSLKKSIDPSIRKIIVQKIKEEKQINKVITSLSKGLEKIKDLNPDQLSLVEKIFAIKESEESYAIRCKNLKNALAVYQATQKPNKSIFSLRFFKRQDTSRHFSAVVNSCAKQLDKPTKKLPMLERFTNMLTRSR